MEPFFKVAAILFVFSVAAIMCGILTSAESSNQNVTPVNDTLDSAIPENVTESPEVEEEYEEEYEEELTPSDVIAIREGEKAEEAAMADEEEEEPEEVLTEEVTEEETDISHVEPSKDTAIEEPIPTQIKAPEKDDIKPITATEKKIFVEEKKPEKKKPAEIILVKTVNKAGNVYVGKDYAGKTVTIIIK